MRKLKAITADEMAKIDQKAAEFGIPTHLLMENAGAAVARLVTEKFGENLKVVVFAGTGNNGGDGLVAARHLLKAGDSVHVFLMGDPKNIRTDGSNLNWKIIKNLKRNIEVSVVKTPTELNNKKQFLKQADVIIDAMLGTGVEGPLREPIASAVKLINESKVPVVAVDSPTGLDPSTGKIHETAVKADYTVTFHKIKNGLFTAKEHTGEVIVADIGIPPEVEIEALKYA